MDHSSPLTAAEKRKLQKLIDRTSKAQTAFHAAQLELNEWCLDRYGSEPGDVDADQIIDAVFGGCGPTPSMSADDFDAEMRDACDL